MRQKFVDLYRHQSVDVAMAVYDALVGYYGEAGRHYHTLAHIARVLDDQAEYFPAAGDSVKLALWFHDVFYIPGRHDNELISAQLCAAYTNLNGLEPFFGTSTVLAAKQAILATDHMELTNNRTSQIVCDLDLLGLADPVETYDTNTAKIRAEYGQYSDELWAIGRKNFLHRFLKRPAIYQTEEMHTWFETAARDNLAREFALYGSA